MLSSVEFFVVHSMVLLKERRYKPKEKRLITKCEDVIFSNSNIMIISWHEPSNINKQKTKKQKQKTKKQKTKKKRPRNYGIRRLFPQSNAPGAPPVKSGSITLI